jgi:hypothetical protein
LHHPFRFMLMWTLVLLVAIGMPIGIERAARSWLQSYVHEQLGIAISVSQLRIALFPPGICLEDVRWGDHAASERACIGTRSQPREVALMRPTFRWTEAPAVDRSRPATKSTSRPMTRLRDVLTSLQDRVRLVIRDGTLVLQREVEGRQASIRATGVFAHPMDARHYRVVAGPVELSWGHALRARLDALSLEVSTDTWQPLRFAALALGLRLPAAGGTRLRLANLRGEWSSRRELTLSSRLVGNEMTGGGGQLRIRTSTDTRELTANLELESFSLRPLASLLAPPGIDPFLASVTGRLRARRAGARLELEGDLSLAQIILHHPLVSSQTLGPFDGQLRVALVVDDQLRDWQLRTLRLTRGPLALELSGKVGLSATKRFVSARISVPPLSCQKLLGALPRGFAPRLRGMALRGSVGLEARVELDGQNFADGAVEVSLEPMSCRVSVDPPSTDVRALNGTISIRVRDEAGRPKNWLLGPENPHYVELEQISPHIRNAFVVAEDARFFAHRGFDTQQLRRAFLFDLRAGRVVRGASTISQQLVKNVFLSHERTLSRKFQEAVLTWRLEQVVSKRRILQTYLNLLELGPGIYGVGPAARRYFGRSAGELNPLQAAHLAALTPSPRPLARRFAHEAPGPAWRERLRKHLRDLRRNGKIDAAAEQRWANEELGLQPYELDSIIR